MYGNLARKELGGFTDDVYWSSTFEGMFTGHIVNFKDGDSTKTDYASAKKRVRAVRQF
jgi:hypothetical protein